MEVNALIVDDSGIMRKMVTRSLKETELAQFIFIEAADGVEGLEKFAAGNIDIIFVDWNMPNMTGVEMSTEVRRIEKHRVPIIMITTESTVGKVEEALDDAGIDCFIVKPFTTEALQMKLTPIFEKLADSSKKSSGFFGKLAGAIG